MARKGGKKSSKGRSNRKILDAFQIAERAGRNSDDSDYNSDNNQLEVLDGVMDARKLLGKENEDDDDDSLDDEEIDSDEALGSDDDYDVLNSKFSQTIRDKRKKAKVGKHKQEVNDLESEDEGYQSIDESKFVSLSEAWDMDDKDIAATKTLKGKNEVVLNDTWETESSEEESESESDENDSDSDSDIFKNSEDEDEDIDLSKTLTSLKSKLKKPEKEKKKLVNDRMEESEFNIPMTGNKLSLADMIGAVDSSVAKDAILIDEPAAGSTEKLKALATPLPKRIQQRHDRSVAYEITKEEVSKWEDVVQSNRQAEVLKFPLNPTVKHNDTATTFRSIPEATTELEKKIENVLTESALVDEKKEATFEEIAIAKMSPEEVKKRTNELRLMRELMLRDEKRAKRIKKIKSKQYRKVHKKERLRNQELVEGSDYESDKEDHDMKRAKERMSLKHKTLSSWAKTMIKSGLSKDANNRAELEEMLQTGEKLREKQLGYEDGDQSDQNISDIENEYDNDNLSADEKTRNKLGKGVLAMDFMKNAEERERQSNLKDIEELRKLENGNLEDYESEGNSAAMIKNQGRRVYSVNAATQREEDNAINKKILQEVEDDNSKQLANKLSKGEVGGTNKQSDKDTSKKEAVNGESDDESNPWLTNSNDTVKKSLKVNIVDKSSSKLAKAAAKISKSKKRGKATEIDAMIDIEQTLAAGHGDSDSEDGADQFSQKELIKEAFAGDDVVTEFEVEKKRVIRDEGDKVEDLTLPGWGDWTGGNKKSKKRKIVRKINGVVEKDKRKDKHLKNVIINEKVNKKNLKYQSSAVPFPFETREQYERSLRMPVGQEWTSRDTHQRLTMPRITTKQGTVIDPLKAPFK